MRGIQPPEWSVTAIPERLLWLLPRGCRLSAATDQVLMPQSEDDKQLTKREGQINYSEVRVVCGMELFATRGKVALVCQVITSVYYCFVGGTRNNQLWEDVMKGVQGTGWV